MAQRTTLTEAQVDLLRWISNGCPAEEEIGEYYRISDAALRRRNLITTADTGARWSAAITDAGKVYLAEVDGPTPPVARQANVSVTEQLITDLSPPVAPSRSLRRPGPPQTRSTTSTGPAWPSSTTRFPRATG